MPLIAAMTAVGGALGATGAAATALGTVATVSTVGAGVSAYSGLQQAKAANNAAEAQATAARAQKDIAKQQQELYATTYQPIERGIAADARVGVDPNIAADRAGAAVRASVQREMEALRRQSERLGLDPSSPMAQEAERDRRLNVAAIEAGSRSQARMQADDMNFARRYQVAQLGRNIPAQSMTVYGGMANQYANTAASLRESSASNMADAGKVFGSLMGMIK